MKILLIIFYLVAELLLSSVASAQERDTIYVYQDEGVSDESLKHTLLTFKSLLTHYNLKKISAQQIKKGHWTKNAILLVMPGGADLSYVKKLNGQGNKIIKKYVRDGGAFLGICAGSYYGSSYVEFDKNGALHVVGDRELRFFKGKAIGPILATYDYKTQSGSRAAKIHTSVPEVAETTVFYNGGGFFEHAEHYSHTKVIGRYANNLPAIILINYGKGTVLLSGVHFEYNPFLLNANDPYLKKIIKSLYEADASRTILFVHLIGALGLKSA